MRKCISVTESTYSKNCDRIEKMLKELNTMAENKMRLLKADDEMGDADKSKIGKLDDLAMSLDKTIGILSKI